MLLASHACYTTLVVIFSSKGFAQTWAQRTFPGMQCEACCTIQGNRNQSGTSDQPCTAQCWSPTTVSPRATAYAPTRTSPASSSCTKCSPNNPSPCGHCAATQLSQSGYRALSSRLCLLCADSTRLSWRHSLVQTRHKPCFKLLLSMPKRAMGCAHESSLQCVPAPVDSVRDA